MLICAQQLGGDLVNEAISSMCVDIHLGVAEAAEAYYGELRRRWASHICIYTPRLPLYCHIQSL